MHVCRCRLISIYSLMIHFVEILLLYYALPNVESTILDRVITGNIICNNTVCEECPEGHVPVVIDEEECCPTCVTS